MTHAIAGYEAEAADLIDRFEAIDCGEVYAPVAHLLPASPSRIADIGAGTGRDAAWFAAKGHSVLAVEPADGLRLAGAARHTSPHITWLKDSLPGLSATLARGATFDRVILCGVWQHIDAEQRAIAMPKLAQLTAPGGLTLMSVRHGPAARPVFNAPAEDTIAMAESAGLHLAFQRNVEAVQQVNRDQGVTFTWLALEQSAS
jgi:SAM-dependent methyltransferase